MDHTDHFDFRYKSDVDMYWLPSKANLFAENLDFIGKIHVFCGGNFSKAPLCYEAPCGAFVSAK